MAVNMHTRDERIWRYGDTLPRERRGFLMLLSGLLAGPLVPARASVRGGPRLLSLREADFQRPHDLAG